MPPPADEPSRRTRLASVAPALVAAVLVAFGARLVSGALGIGLETTLALVGGLALGAVPAIGSRLRSGAKAISGTSLRVGVALLGARFTMDQVIQGGVSAALAAGVVVGAALLVGIWAGRRLGVGGSLGILIPAGMAVCGNSAILALAPVIRARPQETAYAVATITLFGFVGVLLLPLLAGGLGLSSEQAGTWMGLSINDTAQVVGAGYAISEPAGDTATLVKLVRNLAIAPLLVAAAIAWSAPDTRLSGRFALARAVPRFVVGFVLLAVAGSVGLLDVELAGTELSAILSSVSGVLIVVALAALGLSADVRATLQVGLRPFALGLGLWLLIVPLGLGLAVAFASAMPS